MDIYIVNTGSLKTHDFMRENSIKMMHLANSMEKSNRQNTLCPG